MHSHAVATLAAFVAGIVVGTTVRVLPPEIDLVNGVALGADVGAALGAAWGLATGGDYGRAIARGTALGAAAGGALVLFLLVVGV